MKIVVIGGTGVLGSKVVGTLRVRGHDAVATSRSTGVHALTGEGLADALADADVVVDVSNAPTFGAGPVMETVVVDPDTTYFGAPLATNSLVVPA
jgi:uncharacterized protein YbjT (DUF2867 family)